MAIPNRHLDDSIAASLASEVMVTRAQRQSAWASVRARAAHQVILAPYAIPPTPRQPRLPLLARLLNAVRRGLSLTVTDAVCYDRAAVRREVFQHRAASATCSAFSGHLVYYYHPSTLLRVGLF